MRVLITGATGFVGGRIAHRYVDLGDDVSAIVRTRSDELEEMGVSQVDGDLASIRPTTLADIDIVVHTAAWSGSDLAVARATNRDGTTRLVDAALRAGTPRLVHISTTAVYDRMAASTAELTEESPLVAGVDGATGATADGARPYAITKAEAELEVRHGVDRGLAAAILRPPAVLGAGPTSTWGTRVPRRLFAGEPPHLHPTSTFGWVHIDDLVAAVVAAGAARDVFTANVVGGHVPFSRYLDEVRAMLPDSPPPPPGLPDDPPWRGRFATHRAPTILGVPMERRFEDAMAEIADSWRAGDPEART